MKKLMTGNEAIAQGAWEGGLNFASAYPGTPSTEIIENLEKYNNLQAEWAPNEKVAVEAAIGASIAGGRALAAMKNVGVNVSADPIFTYAYMGVNGGFVVVSADDPGMFSSQNEQDNRHYARFAKIGLLEPSDSQEARDMAKASFALSEKLNSTIMLRTTTRVCHGKSLVEVGEREEAELKDFDRKTGLMRFDAVPSVSKRLRVELEERLKVMADYSEQSQYNFEVNHGSPIGVITSGVAYAYCQEVFEDTVDYLKLGFTNPLPMKKIKAFAERHETTYVIEEVEPFIEEQMKAAGIRCIGKAVLPVMGEYSTRLLEERILGKTTPKFEFNRELLVPRPPTLCAGCPHRGFFYELGKIKNITINSDIGCYGLGGAEPLNAKDTCVCMGASAGTGHGFQRILDLKGKGTRAVAVMGDSTFFHSGMNGVLNILYNQSNTITCILDNRITAMTGQQENPGTGFTAHGEVSHIVSIEAVVRAFGAKHVTTINPHDLGEVKAAMKSALALEEPSVIITRYPCALKQYSPADMEEFGPLTKKFQVDEDVCIGCMKCTKTGCPAIHFQSDKRKSSINPAQCVGCSVCSQVCPVKAIKVKG